MDDSNTRQGEGTGIGLALTKELVKLLGGKIEVSTEIGAGTEFQVWLPIQQEAEKGQPTFTTANGSPEKESGNLLIVPETEPIIPETELPLALLIEDHEDVLQYLASCLQGQYRLEMATNGQEGIEKAIECVPDIIISDVMMPKKDGFEVVSTLKQDERTSHIPIVLLTAKADIESRLEGLEHGADAYLAKPFDKKELEVRLRKLIELRRQLQTRYGTLVPIATGKEAIPKEDAFLLKLRQIIEAHLEEPDFGISQLCRELGVSRTQLHRKLKALTGKSTSQVIRTIRMQKARELLQSSDLNISEVGYAVGYTSSSYFTQEFTREFGEPPSRVRN